MITDLQLDFTRFSELPANVQTDMLNSLKLAYQAEPIEYYELVKLAIERSKSDRQSQLELAPIFTEAQKLNALMRSNVPQAMFNSDLADSHNFLHRQAQLVLRGVPGHQAIFTRIGKAATEPVGAQILKVRQMWVEFSYSVGKREEAGVPGAKEAEVVNHAHTADIAREWLASGRSWGQIQIDQVVYAALTATAKYGKAMSDLFPSGPPPGNDPCMTHPTYRYRDGADGYPEAYLVTEDCHGKSVH